MGEHTPGPWKLRKEERPSGIPRIIIGDSEDFADIAEVYTNAVEDFGWPDARLIAAAPELLALARKVHELHELTTEWARGGGDPEEPISAWSRRRTLEAEIREEAGLLIAKAESSTQLESR